MKFTMFGFDFIVQKSSRSNWDIAFDRMFPDKDKEKRVVPKVAYFPTLKERLQPIHDDYGPNKESKIPLIKELRRISEEETGTMMWLIDAKIFVEKWFNI